MRRPLAEVRDEALLAFNLGTQFQNALLPEQIHRKSRCDSVGNPVFGRFSWLAWIIIKNQCVAGLIKLDQLSRDARIRWYRPVFQKIYIAAHQWLFRKEFDNPKRLAPYGQNVAASVVVATGYFQNFRRAAGSRHSVRQGQ